MSRTNRSRRTAQRRNLPLIQVFAQPRPLHRHHRIVAVIDIRERDPEEDPVSQESISNWLLTQLGWRLDSGVRFNLDLNQLVSVNIAQTSDGEIPLEAVGDLAERSPRERPVRAPRERTRVIQLDETPKPKKRREKVCRKRSSS